VYVVVAVGKTPRVPLVAVVPVQPPLAVHEVAFVLDQVSVELLPEVMVVGVALKLTVGAAEVTVTVAEAGADVPPVPLQVSV
jgi:lysine/ornithine N-monooxygenase